MNVDRLKRFPDQNAEKRGTECTAETATDIAGNIDGIAYDAGFTYAVTLRLMGSAPTTAGADPKAALQSVIAFGALPLANQTFDALSASELYEANYANYSGDQDALALQHTKDGILALSSYADIAAYVAKTGWGASLTVKWYEGFNLVPPTGILASPTPTSGYSIHDVAVYGTIAINGVEYLILKAWKGADFGDHGYCYMRREILNSVMLSAWAFNPDASRWANLVGILLTRFPALYPYTFQLLQANQPPMLTVHTFPAMVEKWATAIGHAEGARPYLRNPGNLKLSTLTASWGGTKGFAASDGGYLCQFATDAAGHAALCNFLMLGCEDELRAFHQARTLQAFSTVYGGNPPQGYIDRIASELGVPVDTQISSFL